jgi:hypothetical protein
VIRQLNGLNADPAKWRETQRRSALKQQEKRRAAVVVTRTGQRTTVRRTQIKPVSDKRRVEAAIYRVRRRLFLEANPWCQFPLGCGAAATTVQHRGGRVGDRYLDESLWAASCWHHNGWAEDNPVESKRIGWSVPRVGLIHEMSRHEGGESAEGFAPFNSASTALGPPSSVAPAADTTGHLISSPALVVSGLPEDGAT